MILVTNSLRCEDNSSTIVPMNYLRSYRKEFPYISKRGGLSLYLDDEASNDILEPIAELIAQRKKVSMRRCVSGCMRGEHSHLFVKTAELESFPSRIRATLGLQRKLIGYEWPVAELINTLDAQRNGAPVARLRGYGIRRQATLVCELFLLSEVLVGYVDGKLWLSEPRSPEQIELFLLCVFELMHKLHQVQVCHLDLWVGNIMLKPDNLADMKVVDLENCYIGRPTHWSEALGFQFAFLYLRMVSEHIDEARYDQMVAVAVNAYPGLDRAAFERIYTACKHRQISRKKRRTLLLKGELQLRG